LNPAHEWLEPQTAAPGLPISLSFWAGPGEEATILKAASAYEAATKHRGPPQAFGPLRGEP
jgi:amidase